MDQATERFIAIYNEIDAFLRRLCKTTHHVRFPELVKQGSAKSAAVRSCARDLQDFGEIRNIIVHRYVHGEPILAALPAAVGQFEAMRVVLLSPPKVGSLFSKPVESCDLGDPIGMVATKMFGCNYSQVPAYHRQKLVGLLTTDTIARWMAFCLGQNDGILEEAPVKAVMEHAEYTDNYTLLDPKDTVFDALECFADFHRRGKRLDAIIITHARSKANTPQGMMTASNIPEVHEVLAKSGCK